MGEDVDLGRLAAAYRHRATSAAGLQRAERAAGTAGLGPGSVALDVGGGPGGHAGVFADRGATALVVDRSPEMAAVAAARPRLHAVVGDARALPVRSAVADLVYFHSVVHHGGWEEMVGEAARVAAPGGVVWVWTFAPEHLADSYLGRWFPSVAALDAVRFPPPEDLEERLADLGLVVGRRERDREGVSRTAGEWAAAVEAGFVSTLHLVDPSEIAAGLARFRTAHPDASEEIVYELRLVAVWGRTPSLA